MDNVETFASFLRRLSGENAT